MTSMQCAALALGSAGISLDRSMRVGDSNRSFIEHLPGGFRMGVRYPAIVAFPGRGESDSSMEQYSQLDSISAIVLYPQGLPGYGGKSSWEATPYSGPSAKDYEFATAVTDWLRRSDCVDAARIDFAGKSDGGGFAASAACTIPEVAAVAAISAAVYSAFGRCTPQGRAIALLTMHGTDDPVVPYDGDQQRGLMSTDAWVAEWRDRDGCTGNPDTSTLGSDVTQSVWALCAPGGAVAAYRIAGGGHTWPGAVECSGPGQVTHTVDAAQVMAAFFAAHPRS
ncbi:alpha/beta hydrolase family esterase [Nocardia sp. NPDC020380]|uniref:alpha/beta hydrolase family esterase n=1 Tax=Nocardia sp. NPDC020380 TaxID=3364309 RepID=UPI0037AFFF46